VLGAGAIGVDATGAEEPLPPPPPQEISKARKGVTASIFMDIVFMGGACKQKLVASGYPKY